MNIHDVNNPFVGGELSKGNQVSGKRETDRAQKSADRARTPQETEVSTSQNAAKPSGDMYESAEIRKRASVLAASIENTEPEPREDAVNNARERVKSGYYNSGEFLDRLAVKLVNTGVTRL